MPRIPQYEQQVTPQVVEAGQVSTDLFTGGGQQIRETADQLRAINEQFMKVRDFRETTENNIKATEEIQQIKLEAANADINDQDKFIKRLDEVLNKYSNNITSNTNRLEFSANLQSTIQNEKFKLQTAFQEKQLKQAEGMAVIRLDQFKQRAAVADDIELEELKVDYEKYIQGLVQSGVKDPKEAAQLLATRDKVWSDRRNELINIEINQRKIDLFNAKVEKNNNATKLILDIVSGNKSAYNAEAIEAAIQMQTIDNSIGSALIRVANKPIDEFDMTEDDKAFVEVAETILLSPDPDNKKKGLLNLLDGIGKNKLSETRTKLLMQTAMKLGDEKDKIMAVNMAKDLLEKSKNFDKKDPVLITGLFTGLANGLGLDESYNNALKSYTKKIKPDVSSFPKEGKILKDANGNKARVFPDGTIVEIQGNE